MQANLVAFQCSGPPLTMSMLGIGRMRLIKVDIEAIEQDSELL